MRNKMEMNHVLVVEDDKEIREGVEIYLKSQGYEVFQAADGVEGLEVIEKEDIHLAIVDIMMPRMDGISMVVKLREKYDFPVIFLSAKSEEVDKIMGLNMGADDYVRNHLPRWNCSPESTHSFADTAVLWKGWEIKKKIPESIRSADWRSMRIM